MKLPSPCSDSRNEPVTSRKCRNCVIFKALTRYYHEHWEHLMGNRKSDSQVVGWVRNLGDELRQSQKFDPLGFIALLQMLSCNFVNTSSPFVLFRFLDGLGLLDQVLDGGRDGEVRDGLHLRQLAHALALRGLLPLLHDFWWWMKKSFYNHFLLFISKQRSEFLQLMVLLRFSYHLMPRHDQRDDMSLGVIRTHLSRVAPDWDLWRTLYQLRYSAVVND